MERIEILHFDLYNTLASTNRAVFAPFSHDAQWPEPVPEPMSIVILGSLGAGMFAARRMRRRKK